MTKIKTMKHQFVEVIPDDIQDGILYIAKEFSTAIHKCCCGCGQEVVTPIGPTDWRVTLKDGRVCVYPSIGNWSFPCKSHYWIDGGRIYWAEQWSEARIKAGRRHDQSEKQRQYEGGEKPGFWVWLWRFITRQ